MRKYIIPLLLCLSQTFILSAQISGSGKVPVMISNKPKNNAEQNKNPVNEPPKAPEKKPYTIESLSGGGKFYALVIGISNYNDPQINQLDRPVLDAQSFYSVITSRYTFEPENVKLLPNATIADIINALDYYARLIKPADNFLIFYAGHGIWDKDAEIGYWLPSDATKNSTLAWFRNSTLRDYLRAIKSKHTLLISDACFAGSIFKSRGAFSDATVAINKLYELPSRKAMTSGTYTEVPDQSVFLKYMIDRLQNNFDKYLSSEELFSKFRMAVINNSQVLPQYGVIQDVGDEGGDFIFILR